MIEFFSENFDVLHLIEVWDPTDQANIIKLAEQHKYRYHYLPSIRQETNGCDLLNTNVRMYAEFLIFCLLNQTVPGPINTQQVVQPYPYPMSLSCAEAAIGLSLGAGQSTTPAAGQLCFSCLVTAMQDLPYGPEAYGALQVCGAQQGKTYFNGGQNGQLILSKHKLKDVKETTFTAFMSNRINIYATISDIRIGFGHWAFNVLADYGFGDFQYGITGIDHARDVVENNPDVVVGDLNSGVNYQSDGYNLLLANGYVDLTQTQPVQTWCPPDRLDFQLCINAGGYSAAIDHVMLKTDKKLSSCNAHLFNNALPAVSDHIGVAATVNKLWFTNSKLEKQLGF